MKDVIAVVSGRLGEIAIRRNCSCGLCRAYREEPTVVIRTLAENRKRAGIKSTLLEQQHNASQLEDLRA